MRCSAFCPPTKHPGTLAGCGLAEITTDLLISKGINKYFVADAGAAAALKNENVTMDLALTAKNGSVIIEAKVLDKDNNNAVLWQKTVVDTPAADVLVAGTDSPAAPYITSGYFTLFCYADYDSNAVEDRSTVTYDNAIVFSPPWPRICHRFFRPFSPPSLPASCRRPRKSHFRERRQGAQQ